VFTLPLAWALYRWRLFSRTVLPYVAACQAVPGIAVAPLMVLWIGYGTLPIVVLCAFMAFIRSDFQRTAVVGEFGNTEQT